MNTSLDGRRGAPRLNLLAAGVISAFGLAAGFVHTDSAQAARERTAGNRNTPVQSTQRDPAHRINRIRDVARPTAPSRPAAIIVVANCDDDGAGSLRQALADSVDGDTIDLTSLSCSTITLTSGQLDWSTSVTINGPGRDNLTITAAHASRVLYHGGVELAIDGVTIADGASDGAGGCTWIGGNLTMSNSRVTGCRAGDGTNTHAYGAGLDVIGDLQLNNSIVSGNSSTASISVFGGGIYAGGNAYINYGSVVSGNTAIAVDGSDGMARGGGVFAVGNSGGKYGTVSDNQVRSANGTAYGGGVHANGGGVVFAGSTISGNTAHSTTSWTYGGGIQAGDDFGNVPGDVLLVSSSVSGNAATSDCEYCFIQGGGAHAFGGIGAKYSTIRGNTIELAAASSGTARGGGLATFEAEDEGPIQLLQSTVSGNAAVAVGGISYGGGVASTQSHVSAYHATVAFNSAGDSGGGISASTYAYAGTGESQLVSTIVSDNNAASGADIAPNPWVGGTLTATGDHNLVGPVGTDVVLPGDTIGGPAALLPLAMNGGPTATHALAPCSAAIDAGSNPDTLEWDQRGDPFVRESGAGPDIGSFELQPNADVIFADGFEASPCGL